MNFEILEEFRKMEKSGREYIYCKCRCRCGEIFETRRHHIKNRKACSVNCKLIDKSKRRGKNSFKWRGYGDISAEYFADLRCSAKNRRGISFDITIEQAWDLFQKQNRRCRLTNELITLQESYRTNDVQTASLDRIDSKKPYILSNVQWVHKTVQRMKWELDQQYFIELCGLVLNPVDEGYNAMLDFSSDDYRWRGCGAISGMCYQGIRNSARLRNKAFNLSVEDCWKVFQKQEGKCSITNQNLIFGTTKRDRSKTTASLDRIDSSKDYNIENVQWVHKHINKIKYTLSMDDLYKWCELIHSYGG